MSYRTSPARRSLRQLAALACVVGAAGLALCCEGNTVTMAATGVGSGSGGDATCPDDSPLPGSACSHEGLRCSYSGNCPPPCGSCCSHLQCTCGPSSEWSCIYGDQCNFDCGPGGAGGAGGGLGGGASVGGSGHGGAGGISAGGSGGFNTGGW